MKLRDKARFFHDLSQLVRSGIALPKAFDMLLANSGLGNRTTIARISDSLNDGNSVSESLAKSPSVFGKLELGVITASERSGKLDEAFKLLSDYFEEQAKALSTIWTKLAYPLFILHMGMILLGIPNAVVSGNWGAYFKTLGVLLIACWGGLFLLISFSRFLLKLSLDSLVLDQIFMRIPLLGQIRRRFALSRFFGTYNMQLDSGANVITCLESAALASGSASIRSLIQKITPAVSSGGQVGPLLGTSSIFPPTAIQTIIVGEQTGRLDEQLKRLSSDSLNEAISRLEKVTEWTPRLIYLAILLYIASRIIGAAQGYFKLLDDIMK